MDKRTIRALIAGMVIGGFGMMAGSWVTNPAVNAAPVAAQGSSGVIAITTDSPTGTQLLYLVDSQQQVFSVYEFDSKKTKLKLAAVRRFAMDHQLQEYNTESPTVSDIEHLVRPR